MLEGSDAHNIQKVWNFNEQTKKREKDEADEVVIEFKLDQLDPTRKIVEWDKQANIMKRNKLSK